MILPFSSPFFMFWPIAPLFFSSLAFFFLNSGSEVGAQQRELKLVLSVIWLGFVAVLGLMGAAEKGGGRVMFRCDLGGAALEARRREKGRTAAALVWMVRWWNEQDWVCQSLGKKEQHEKRELIGEVDVCLLLRWWWSSWWRWLFGTKAVNERER